VNQHPVLEQLAAAGVRLGLERVRSLLAHLGDPHLHVPSVHVAGTNGKGSTCMMVSACLAAAGYRVGTNLSPHLEQINERVRFDTVPIDDVSLNDLIEALDRHRSDWARAVGESRAPLTYFEFMTVLAMIAFASRPVDVSVFETGMGGRLDATNVLSPVVTAITTIGLDHQEELGDTIALIAAEKAGILKRGVPVVLGLLPDEAREVIEAQAKRVGAEVWRPGPELRRESRKGRLWFYTPEGAVGGIVLPLAGDHMAHNAMIAVGVLHRMRKLGFHIPDDAIIAGLQTVEFGGRIEEVRPGLIVDGAHNVDGARALAAWLAQRPRPDRRILLFGMGRGRDVASIIEPLLPHFDEVVTTRCSHPKAIDPMDLGLALQDAGVEVTLAAGRTLDEDLAEVYTEANETVVAGSLFLAGAARSLVRAGVLDGLEPGSAEPDEE
jgi:dihydrofolate synthase/folylpolyglutamate synthase